MIVGGCGFAYKEGSMQASQPKGIGPVRVHLTACSYGFPETPGPEEPPACAQNDDDEEDPGQAQRYVAFALPPGTVAPSTITVTGVKGGAPTETFSRSSSAAGGFAAWHPPTEGKPAWPPAGTEIVAYGTSAVRDDITDEFQWSIDAEFTPPTLGAPLTVTAALAWQGIAEKFPAGRSLNCGSEAESSFIEQDTICEVADAKTIGTSNLAIAPPAPVSLLPGGSATLTFPAALTSSATPPPAFGLSAATGLAGATATPATPGLAGSSAAVAVRVPSAAKPGAYPVTLTATATGGGTVSQTGTVTVVAAKLKFGKVKLNKQKGTALVSVTVPSGGTLNVSGKGFTKVTKKAGAAKTLKVNLKAKGSTAAALATVGKAPLETTFKFKPSNGAVFSKPRTVVLKLSN
jgi:hypothetical protein